MQQLFLKAPATSAPVLWMLVRTSISSEVDADGSGKVALTTLEQGPIVRRLSEVVWVAVKELKLP